MTRIRISYEGEAKRNLSDNGWWVGAFSYVSDSTPLTVEVLPEPITFSDGDVLRCIDGTKHGALRFRIAGRWTDINGGTIGFADADYADLVEHGEFERVTLS